MNSIRMLKCAMLFCSGFFILESSNAQTTAGAFSNSYTLAQNVKVPVRIAIDPADNIYLTDALKNVILKYDSLRNLTGTYVMGEHPVSLTVADDFTLFSGDGLQGKIYKKTLGGAVTVIYSDSIFPSDMVTGPDNLLYVVDSKSKRVLVMDFSGNLIRTIGDGVFLYPTGIAFDRKNNRIIVSEHGGFGDGFNLHSEIRIFSLTGTLISTFGGWGNGNGKFYRVQGLTVGRCGNIYATDPFQGTVSVFTENGSFITRFGQWGTAYGQLNVPMDVVFDSKQRVLITSLNNSAVEFYDISDSLPSSTMISGTSTICNGGSTPVLVNFTGTPPWTFTYTVNGSNPQTISTQLNPFTIQATLPGAYNIVSLSDANHTGTCFSKTTNVQLATPPTATLQNTNITICQGESVDVPITFSGTPPWSFSYTRNGASPVNVQNINNTSYSLQLSQAGTYELSSLSGNGCPGSVYSGTAVITLNPTPTVQLNTTTEHICEGSSASIAMQFSGIGPWSVSYTRNGQNPTSITDIAQNNFNVETSDAGIYQILTVMDSHCSGNVLGGTLSVMKHSRPTAFIPPMSNSICQDDSVNIPVQLIGTPPFNFVYSRNNEDFFQVSNQLSSQYDISAKQEGDYLMISVSDNYCNNQNFNEVYHLQVNPNPVVYLGADTSLCTGQSMVLNAAGNDFYMWNDFSTNSSLTVLNPGLYYITASNIYGCTAYDSILVSGKPNPIANFTFMANDTQVNFNNNSSQANSFYWNFGDGSSSTDVNPIHNFPGTGIYLVELSSISQDCGTAYFSDTVKIIPTSIYGESVSSTEVLIFPNPTQAWVTIQVNNPAQQPTYVSIYNCLGQQLFNYDFTESVFAEKIDMSHFASGIYTLKVRRENSIKTEKIILHR